MESQGSSNDGSSSPKQITFFTSRYTTSDKYFKLPAELTKYSLGQKTIFFVIDSDLCFKFKVTVNENSFLLYRGWTDFCKVFKISWVDYMASITYRGSGIYDVIMNRMQEEVVEFQKAVVVKVLSDEDLFCRMMKVPVSSYVKLVARPPYLEAIILD